MKIQTNIRAGRQNRNSADTVAAETTSVEVPSVPVSRCVGI